MNTLLRIEAINLAFVIDDTEDLSTRRGGSFMLLDAVRQLAESFATQLEPISTGASIGLFALKPGVSNTPKLLQEVRDVLQMSGKPHAHATFAVDLVNDADFRLSCEKAVGANRWRQMQELNFVTDWGNADTICTTDEIRPATHRQFLPEGISIPLSASVHARREAGRALRQSLYARILETKTDLCFTNDTVSLSAFPNPPEPQIPANLNGKMAVFYADGNRFGRIQRNCQNAKALQAWDSEIKAKRQALLRDLLAWLEQNPWAKTDTGERRFETLLWGGDELLFLLPAWLGLEFADKFFALTAPWEHDGNPLTHATSLVFAKHSTPISQLQKLARQLADHGKTAARRTQNTLSWVVLESFDHTGAQIDKFWARNGIQNAGWDKLLLTVDRLSALRAMTPLKDALPRSAMIRALRTLASGRQDDQRKLLQATYRSTEQAMTSAQRSSLSELWQVFGTSWASELPTDALSPNWAEAEAVPWTALLELWDYLLPSAPDNAARPAPTIADQEIAQ